MIIRMISSGPTNENGIHPDKLKEFSPPIVEHLSSYITIFTSILKKVVVRTNQGFEHSQGIILAKVTNPILSEKDTKHPTLSELKSPFQYQQK